MAGHRCSPRCDQRLDQAIIAYITTVEDSGRLMHSSIRLLHGVLRRFITHTGGETHVADVTQAHLDAYQRTLERMGHARRTVRGRLRDITQFLEAASG